MKEFNIYERDDILQELVHQIANKVKAQPFEPDSFIAEITPLIKHFGESTQRYGKNLAKRAAQQVRNAEEGKRELGSPVFNLLRGHIVDLEKRIEDFSKMPKEKFESPSMQRTIQKTRNRIAQYRLAIAILIPLSEPDMEYPIEKDVEP